MDMEKLCYDGGKTMSTAGKSLPLAVWGAGSVTRLLYRPALADPRLASVFSWQWLADPQPGEAFEGPQQVVALPYEQAWAKADLRDQAQAVIVALPHHLHRDAVCAALSAGKHVLCEKPAAMTLSELNDMASASKASGCVIAYCHFRRHLAAARALHDVFQKRLWGDCVAVRWFEGEKYGWPASALDQIRRQSGGEVLYDIGAHVFDLLGWWLGPLAVRSCQADDRGGSAASFDVVLEAGTTPVSVSLSRARRYQSRVEMEFERARVTWVLAESDRLRVQSDLLPEGEAVLVFPGPTTAREGFVQELRQFAAACNGEEANTVGVEHAQHYVSVFEQCAAKRVGKEPIEVTEASPFGNDPVVVTGASGFIGGRCVERLLSQGVTPIAMASRAMSCVRLMRDPVEPVLGDITDPNYVSDKIAERSVIFHCAAHIGERKAMQRTIIKGAKVLLEVAEAKRAKAVIILGSMLAHGCPPETGTVTEFEQYPFKGDAYGEAKAGMWRVVSEMTRTMKTRVVVLEPTCVFGPTSESFVATPIERMLAGKLMTLDQGSGRANLIHVDHLIDAMWKAFEYVERLHGKRFLLNEDERDQTWRSYFSALGKVVGLEPLPVSSAGVVPDDGESKLSGIAAIREAVRHYPPAARYVSAHPVLRWKRRMLGQPVEVNVPRFREARRSERDAFFDHPVVRALYTTRAIYSSTSFRQATGWKPTQSREACLATTAEWIKDTWPDACTGEMR